MQIKMHTPANFFFISYIHVYRDRLVENLKNLYVNNERIVFYVQYRSDPTQQKVNSNLTLGLLSGYIPG